MKKAITTGTVIAVCLLVFTVLALTACTDKKDDATVGQLGDYDAFLASLTETGFRYNEDKPDTDSFLSVTRKPIWIGDEIISIYEYESSAAMEADAAGIDNSGFSISSQGKHTNVSWVSNPYFFKKDTLIINYVGENDDIIRFLSSKFGTPFAGYGVNAYEHESRNLNALVPSIMIEGTLYLMSQKENLVIEIPENDYLGRIGSTVPLSEWPTENEQANIDVEDAPYAEYGNGIVVLWNGEWTLFLTEQERLLEE